MLHIATFSAASPFTSLFTDQVLYKKKPQPYNFIYKCYNKEQMHNVKSDTEFIFFEFIDIMALCFWEKGGEGKERRSRDSHGM